MLDSLVALIDMLRGNTFLQFMIVAAIAVMVLGYFFDPGRRCPNCKSRRRKVIDFSFFGGKNLYKCLDCGEEYWVERHRMR